MKIDEIAFSCYAVNDMAESRQFYEGVLGLKPSHIAEKAEGSWVEYEIGPHTLSLGCADGWKPSPDGCSVGLEVADFDEAIAELRRHGVKFRIEPFPTPVCQMAMIFDPSGNSICIHKRKMVGEAGTHQPAA